MNQSRLLIQTFISLFVFLASFQSGYGQADSNTKSISVPIPFEFLGGNNRFALQTLINKHFTPGSKFNLLSVTSASASYDNNLNEFDFINTSEIGYELHKGFGATLGISMNAKTGFSPTAGIEYVYAKPSFLYVIAPGVLLTNNHNLEVISVLEYKPVFKNYWGMYSRLQGLYNYNSKESHHERSYFNVRIGPSFKQFSFGAGANFDWYGAIKLYKENYGLFLRYSFL